VLNISYPPSRVAQWLEQITSVCGQRFKRPEFLKWASYGIFRLSGSWRRKPYIGTTRVMVNWQFSRSCQMVERPVWSAKWIRPGPDRPELTWLKGPGDVISNPEFYEIPRHKVAVWCHQVTRMWRHHQSSSAGPHFSNLTTYSTASHGYGFSVRVWVYCIFGLNDT